MTSSVRYKDNPEESEEADGGGHLASPSQRNSNDYRSIQTDEEDPVHRIRRRHPPRSSSCCSWVACCWLFFMFLLILASMALVVWRFELKQHPEGINLFDGNESILHSFFPGHEEEDTDKETSGLSSLAKSAIPSSSSQLSVKYDPKAALHYYNPFDFTQGDWYGSVAVPPPIIGEQSSNDRLGFFMQPNLVGNHLLFVSEGDVYYTTLDTTSTTAAMKLTTTVGNVRFPVINPTYPYYVAFTATYTGYREVYLMDLRPSHRSLPATRLTYWDTEYGISKIVGWKDDGLTLVFAAVSREIGLPDMRLYQIQLQQPQPQDSGRRLERSAMQVLRISPIPLSQAIDATWKDGCIYFTRFQQSSMTVRYVGGTVESLWAFCEGQTVAVPLTSKYKGTSKNPHIATIKGEDYLFFQSDRDTTQGITPSTMNLFATKLPTEEMLYNQYDGIDNSIALTQVSCNFNGLSLQEYSIDTASGNAILRIGADLYFLSKASIEDTLSGRPTYDVMPLDIVIYSDFHENQERIIPVKIPDHITSIDAFDTAFGSSAALLGVRGQLFVAPVVPDISSQTTQYAGAGMNLPHRRYRVAPGATTGGIIRILSAVYVPMPQEEGKTTRRLAIILGTDPASPTAEHAFYLIEVQSDSSPSFVDIEDLPEPFLGGSKNGGSVQSGAGLGSVNADKVTVSPCGRRLAWTDTDGRICVMTTPMYQENGNGEYKVLSNKNEDGEPVIGTEATLSWSPGGRYLAVEHTATNQFRMISIADCGDPNAEGTDKVANVDLGRIIQATQPRFNSFSAFWGKSAMDFAVQAQASTIAEMTRKAPPRENGATTLYFLTDRDVVSDVDSPWGTRAPAPHVIDNASVYALPLMVVQDDSYNPMHGIFAGGGAAELWADGMIDLKLQLDARKQSAKGEPSKEAGARRLTPNHLLALVTARRAYERSISDSASMVEPQTGFLHDASPSETPSEVPSTSPLDFAGKADKTAVPALASVNTNTPTTSASVDAGGTDTQTIASSSPSTNPSLALTSSDIPSSRPSLFSKYPSVAPSTVSPTTFPSVTPSLLKRNDSFIFPNDGAIEFGSGSLEFSRKAYRIVGIPPSNYKSILCQLKDDPSLVLIEENEKGAAAKIFAFEDFPSDKVDPIPLFPDSEFVAAGISSSRDHLLLIYSPGIVKVIPNEVISMTMTAKEEKLETNIVDTSYMAVSVNPSLEYAQMFKDAWRLLRDYFYDTNMNGIDWREMLDRYKDLVKRCSKREELDDILAQMASELSALHVFVYGGEYNDPVREDDAMKKINEVPCLGATFERSVEFKGYIVTSIAHRDPDFNLNDGRSIYSPLSSQSLELSGQRGLEVGDVVVGINGESVMRVPDMHMLLRGTAGRSVRFDVIRQPEARRLDEFPGNSTSSGVLKPEPIIAVPLPQKDGENLRYAAWEWNTRQKAKEMARDRGFSLGYVHLRSMEGPSDVDAFMRGFFPDYNKDALIIDVRHNRGGNIDSWLLDILQRKAWMFWQDRATNIYNGGLGWDEQFAFRGHLVVLVDEKTSSDGEGFARGVSELGLGRLVGTRTWGGGIWLSSDNHLVDGGIATAPEVGTYNDHFGWGLGIEQQGVEPDVVIDNNPKRTFDGNDEQLEKAVDFLAQWLQKEPIAQPKAPAAKKDMSLKNEIEHCSTH